MRPYCKINGHYVWNYERLKTYFSRGKSYKDYYFENDDNTMSYLKVVNSPNHFMPFSKYEGEKILLKCAISTPEILDAEIEDEDDQCRHCMKKKQTPACDLPGDIWGDDREYYDDGHLLSICEECLKLPKKYTVENIEIFSTVRTDVVKIVTSDHSDVKYMISAGEYRIYFYEKVICVNDVLHEPLFLNERYDLWCCKLCGGHNKYTNICKYGCNCNFYVQKYYDNLILNFWFIKQIDIGYGDADVKFYIQQSNIS